MQFHAIVPKTTQKNGKIHCVGATLAGNRYQGEVSKPHLEPGYYYCQDGGDISLLVAYLGGSWEIFLAGRSPLFAFSDKGVKIRSLHRIGSVASLAIELGEPDACDDLERAWQVYMVATRYRQSIESLCGSPEKGLTSVVQALAPGLEKIRKHEGSNLLFRQQAYFGGRTEVFRGRSDETVVQYDMRSAYAWAYGETIPGSFIDVASKVPSGDNFIAKVRVSVPSSSYIPPVPFRSPGGTLVFPIGEWDTMLCGPEFRAIEPSGMIQKVEKVYAFRESDALASLSAKLFAIRNATKCPVEKALCKTLLVTAYGVLGAQPTFPKIIVRPKSVPAGAKMISPGVYQVESRPRRTMGHVAAAAIIASRVRARLWGALYTAGMGGQGGESAYYCDTDSIFVSRSASQPWPMGNGAGDWRAVGEYPGGSIWVAPKTYSLGGGAVLRASGVSVREAARYLSGEMVSTRKVTGFEHVLTKGYATEVPVTVTLRADRKNKRSAKEDYRTLPLTIEEARKHDD